MTRKLKIAFFVYAVFDLFFGGFCGGLLPLALLHPQARGQGLVTVVGQTLPTQLNPATVITSQAGAVTNPSSNFVVNITGGPISCQGGELQYMNASQLTLTANTTNLLVYNCVTQNPPLYTKTAVTGPGSNGTNAINGPGIPASLLFAVPGVETAIATIVCNATACGNGGNGSITDNRVVGSFPVISDATYIVPLGDCQITIGAAGTFAAAVLTGAGNGGSNPGPFRTAAGSSLLQAVTTAAANNLNLDCDITPPSKLTANKGAIINNVQLFYGVQTTALTSITAPTVQSLTYPATGAAAGLTNATAGGSLTVTPGTLQLATTTSGQCYSENIALGTPVLVNTDLQRVTLDQVFNQTAAAATTLQVCGVIVHYSYLPL